MDAKRTGQPQWSSVVRNFELDLLMIVLQRNLTLRMFALSGKPINLFAHLICWYTIIPLALEYTHSFYHHAEIRALSFSICSEIMLTCFVFLLPFGILHQHNMKTLFNPLWSLNAQLSMFQSNEEVNKLLLLETNVAIQNLRRELSNSDRISNYLAYRVVGIPITYNNMMRAAFWIMILVMAISDNSDRFHIVISDPFGLFNFEKSVNFAE